jgi:hypothetical protein
MRIEDNWVELSNTTPGMPVAMVNSSILLIALPDIFRGIEEQRVSQPVAGPAYEALGDASS